MLEKRGEEAGVKGVNPHRWRRTSATKFRRNGGSEEEATHVYGWKSTAMVRHYTKSEAKERAREAHAKFSLGDRF
jgi:integrase